MEYMKLKYKDGIIIAFCLALSFSSCGIYKGYQGTELKLPDYYRYSDTVNVKNDTVIYSTHDFFRNATLLALLDTALVKNSNLLIAVKNIESAEASLRTAKLNYLPDINAQINGNYNKYSKNSATGLQIGGTREAEDYTLSAGMTWSTDIWGKIKWQKEEALAVYLQKQEVRKAVQTKLVADIAKGYYNLLMLDAQLEIAKKSKELSDSTLQIIQLQYRVGQANALGIQQVKAQLEQNSLLISQIEQSISLQESALSLLCGNYAKKIGRRLAAGEEFCKTPDEGYPVSLLAVRPDIQSAEFGLRAANARVGISHTEMYPSLSISLSGGLNSLTTSNWFSMPASLFGTVAGGITQPVFNRGKLKAKYKQALIEREKEVIAFRQAVFEGYSQVSDALKSKQEVEKQLIFAQNREKVLQESIQTSNVIFKTGMINYLEIITAQSNYLQARLQTAQIYTSKIATNIELYYALGGGWK